MHRKKQSRARQARRHQAQQMALAKEKATRLALDIRRLNNAHREEVFRLHNTINDAFHKLRQTVDNLSCTVKELTEEVQSLKRMTHAETVLRANVKPEPRGYDG
jgi:hypothetical protein